MLNKEIILKSQLTFKSHRYDVYIQRVNEIALSNNDDKRLQTFDRITPYTYGATVEKIRKKELLSKYKWFVLTIIQIKIK